MRLSPAAFNSFLSAVGQQVMWRRAHRCPNINIHSGAAATDCVVCSGKGWFWDAAAGPYVIGIPSQSQQRKFANSGMFVEGDMVATIPSTSPVYAMAQFDRLIMLNSTSPYAQVLTRGENDVLPGRIQAVTEVFWMNSDNTATVAGGIPTVGSDGTLTWSTGAPPDGHQYTIAYTSYDDYFVYLNLPSDRNEHQGAPLPRRAQLRKFDLFGRSPG